MRRISALAGLVAVAALMVMMAGRQVSAQEELSEFRESLAGFAETPIRGLDPYGVSQLLEKVKRGVITVQNLSDITSGMPGGLVRSVGSGFVIDQEGHALTNYHVAGQSGIIKVSFWDGSNWPAKLVAGEPGIDAALIKIYAPPGQEEELKKRLHPIPLGDSDAIAMGEFVLTFGNPGWGPIATANISDYVDNWFLKQTANIGEMAGRVDGVGFQISIYSAYIRRASLGLQYGTNLVRPIRMAAAINGGNSGGPLINARGEVVGINSWGGSIPSVAEVLNTAVAINQAKEFAFSVIETGKFERPWIGLDVLAPRAYLVSPRYYDFVETKRPRDRIVIFGVRRNSPAEKAGFKAMDEIITIDGLTFPDPESVRAYILSRRVGDELEFHIRRQGKELTITVKAVAKPMYNSDFSV